MQIHLKQKKKKKDFRINVFIPDDLLLNIVKVSHKRFVVKIIQNKKNKFQKFSFYFERFERQTV